MAKLTLGTFNVNNLFSRFNFKTEIPANKKGKPVFDVARFFDPKDPSSFRARTYQGKLINPKDPADRQLVAQRIKTMNLDVIALQEVEDIDTLRAFDANDLSGLYPFRVLVEGNDPRLIDVAILSKYPLGAVTSWQHARHPADPSEPIFSRDLLQVEVLDMARARVLLTVFNNHLKSKLLADRSDPVGGKAKNDLRRKRQAEVIALLLQARMPASARYAVLGDMNDSPGSKPLAPFANSTALNLTNALANPAETQPAKPDNPPPPTKAWTHRFKEANKPAAYELLDQIWLSPALAGSQTGAWIGRRSKHSGDGSDHDPAWIELSV